MDNPSQPLASPGTAEEIYQKRSRSKSVAAADDDDDDVDVDAVEIVMLKLNSYDRNKRNNETSHIYMPTFESSVRSGDSSTASSTSTTNRSKEDVRGDSRPGSAQEAVGKEKKKQARKSGGSGGRRSSCSHCSSSKGV